MAVPIFSSLLPTFKSFSSLLSFPIPNYSYRRLRLIPCRNAKPSTGPVKKRSSSAANKKNKKSKGGADDSKALNLSDVETVVDSIVVDDDDDDDDGHTSSSSSLPYHPMPLPKPPAGFFVDEHGKVLLASTKCLATIDQNGMLQIADDVVSQYEVSLCSLLSPQGNFLKDPAIISAIDEETEFNALVEEEDALLDSLLGKR